MATSSIEIAANAYSGAAVIAASENATNRSVPTPKAATEAVRVTVSPEAIEASETAETEAPKDPVIERKAAIRQAEELKHSLNQTTVKFDVKLHDGEASRPGALSAFSFQVVDRETGKVVRQFPPDDIMKVTQQPEGLYVDQSA